MNALTGAYRHALKSLHLVDRNDPEIVAKKIIGVGATGVRDPAQIQPRPRTAWHRQTVVGSKLAQRTYLRGFFGFLRDTCQSAFPSLYEGS